MKTIKLAFSLAVVASLLSACGGGGGSNSPDRPGMRLDPATLRIEFVNNNNVLAGTGNAMISARMLGLQTDTVSTNLTPELNVTANTTWSITGADNDPVVAELADAVRSAPSLGAVQDILSSVRLATTDTVKNLTLQGIHRFNNRNYTETAAFTVRPPIPNGAPFISGPSVIALDPVANVVPTGIFYQLLQPLKEIPTPENQTNNFLWCAKPNTNFMFSGDNPPIDGSADVTLTNPFFNNPDDQTVVVTVQVIDANTGYTCDQIGTEVTPAGGGDPFILQPKASKQVQLIPAVVQDGGVAVCGIINAEADACSTTGEFNDAAYLADCNGFTSNSIDAPAGENLQLVARLTYTNPNNVNQTAFIDYRCMADGYLAWSADPQTIFNDPGLDADDGSASLISRSEYLDIASTNPSSLTTGTFTNANGTAVSDALNVNLVDSTVTALDIVPVDPNNVDNLIPLNFLNTTLDYRAQCTYGETNPVVATCADACVKWSVSAPSVIAVDPEVGSTTTVSAVDYNGAGGTSDLTATYTCSTGIADTIGITTAPDPVVAIRLLQDSNANDLAEPSVTAAHLNDQGQTIGQPNRFVDPFSCVGRTDVVGTLADGTVYINGTQQFHAHAIFESDVEGLTTEQIAALDPSDLRIFNDVTNNPAITFSALPGYAGNTGSCATVLGLDGLDPLDSDGGLLGGIPILGGILDFYLGGLVDILTIPLDFLPGLTNGAINGLETTPAAAFNSGIKGELQAAGNLRLSTVCVQAYATNVGDPDDSEDDTFVYADDSSTVLVLPVADDNLLNFSNEVCEVLEPALTLGSGGITGNFLPAGAIVPLVYGLGLVADPVLAAVDGVADSEALIDALITGNFSDLGLCPSPGCTDAPFGLGALTGGLLGDAEGQLGLEGLVDILDSCALDPVLLNVQALLSGLLTLDPTTFDGIAGGDTPDCTALFDAFDGLDLLDGGLGLPEFPDDTGLEVPTI